jgi:hypothetical protein
MKEKLSSVAILLGGVMVGVIVGLLLSAEQRLKLSQGLATLIGGMAEHMPDG